MGHARAACDLGTASWRCGLRMLTTVRRFHCTTTRGLTAQRRYEPAVHRGGEGPSMPVTCQCQMGHMASSSPRVRLCGSCLGAACTVWWACWASILVTGTRTGSGLLGVLLVLPRACSGVVLLSGLLVTRLSGCASSGLVLCASSARYAWFSGTCTWPSSSRLISAYWAGTRILCWGVMGKMARGLEAQERQNSRTLKPREISTRSMLNP